ncbi:MAG: hypothetical protein HY763_03700 [Planctomycetes bacterium]|nr:hypothetical protein [Planctomycetota bacterium]
MIGATGLRGSVLGLVGVVGMSVATTAQAEPSVHYTRVYQTQPAYIDYGTPYVQPTTVRYVEPPVVVSQPVVTERVVVTQPAVTYVSPVYVPRVYYSTPVVYAPPVRVYHRPVYYGPVWGGHYYHHGHHRSWGFGIGGGGASFHYSRRH